MRTRIGVLFSVITMILIIVLSRFSYVAVREVYLDQLSRQVRMSAKAIATDMDMGNIKFVQPYSENSVATQFYKRYLKKKKVGHELASAFIFDAALRMVMTSDDESDYIHPDPTLLLSQSEIERLAPGETSTTLPFLGNDNEWYMWGFCRIDDEYWAGVRAKADQLMYIENLSFVFWFISGTALVFTLFGSFWLAKTITKPIDQMVRFSRSLGRGEWDTEAPKHVKGELASLATAMEQMRTDIQGRHKEKEELLAQIAHEIRNPLGGIELMAGLVYEDMPPESQQSAYIRQIRKEVSGLKNLVHQYLEFGRPAQAVGQLIDIRSLCVEVEQLLLNEIKNKKIEINYSLSVPMIFFDPQHFRQIMLNLFANAVEALEMFGKIEVESKIHDSYIHVSIRDNGKGIDEKWLSQVFEPFFTRSGHGNGLGLAICKKLCTANGATIHIENRPESGCSVTMRLKQTI
ncbi:MAG TPA: HAMP domain-containing sensor histidine kinase [bacterium]|nr:HAMP domain-containing sensor histidine kinase [bacterium]HMY36278.1 HAMP domain-containing sensor histidine kinase [bacterium]HND76271.1 HAMP domain-containing sensor histidine kinase [bacterium]HNH31316.1 HAMP domain-containing sensor histidine kinase [bacterium]HNO89674.1 HAMP domain-containing sensor histidine kinase [bacterium]